jgi:hypothetical protein
VPGVFYSRDIWQLIIPFDKCAKSIKFQIARSDCGGITAALRRNRGSTYDDLLSHVSFVH